MNNASEHDIDRVLTALRDTEPSAGLETRILKSLENRPPARSAGFRWTLPMQWGIAALATAAVILAAALITHTAPSPTTTIAQTSGPSSPTQTWGDPSSPEASSPAKVGLHNDLSAPSQKYVILSNAKDPLLAHPHTNSPHPPHQLLCDCDPLALAETQAPSHPAPVMPLTAQERLLQRVVHQDDPMELAELEPLRNNPLRRAATANEDVAIKNVVQNYLKQLAAAEALNPTPPAPEPPPASDPDANDPVPSVESASSPN